MLELAKAIVKIKSEHLSKNEIGVAAQIFL